MEGRSVSVITGQGNDTVFDLFAESDPEGWDIKIGGAGQFKGSSGTDLLDLIIEIDDPTLLEITRFELFESP